MWDWSWWQSPDAERTARRLVRKASPGDIVVIHDGHHEDPARRPSSHPRDDSAHGAGTRGERVFFRPALRSAQRAECRADVTRLSMSLSPRRVVIVAAACCSWRWPVALALTVRVLLGGDRIKAAVESQASAALGQPVTIRAAVPRLLPRIGLELTGITVGAAREVTIDQARLTTGLPGAPRRPGRRRRDFGRAQPHRRALGARLLGALADSAPSATHRAAGVDD